MARAWSRRAVLAGAALAAGGCATRPEAHADLDAVVDLAMANASTSLLVMHEGRVAAEAYAPGWGPDRPREVASVAKSMVAVLIAMAIEDGRLFGLDQPAAAFIPAWREDARSAITLRHLMSMTSGLDDAGLALRGIEGDQFAVNAAMSLRDAPGARWAYNTAAYHLLFHILERAVGGDLQTWARDRLLAPLRMDRTDWITNIGQTASGPVTNYYSARSTARDLARFGDMVMSGGVSRGQRIVGADGLRDLLAPSQALNPSYGLLWWTNAQPGHDATGREPGLRFPGAPGDTIAALGAGGQSVVAIPSLRLILVRQGGTPSSPDLIADLVSRSVATIVT